MKRRHATCLITLLVLCVSVLGQQQARFDNVTAASGIHFQHTSGASPEKYLPETMGSGGVFLDFDEDGWIDIFLVDGGAIAAREAAGRARHRLYRNTRNGTFEDVTHTSGITQREYGMGACAADYDNDGAIDLYVTNLGANVLYRNDGTGRFTDTTRTAGVGSVQWSTSCAFADIERDGDVDLFVTNYLDWTVASHRFCGDARNRIRSYCHPTVYKGAPSVLYRNNGDGTFTDATTEAGVFSTAGKSLGVVFGDYDVDGWPDFFVANDSVPNFLYHNERGGRFREVALKAGVAVADDGKARAGMGTDFGDYDGDGLLDLIVTNLDLEMHTLFRNLGGGVFEDRTFTSGIGGPTRPFVGFGTAFFDYDNDGRLDLAIANGNVIDNASYFRPGASHAQRNLLFRNQGGGRMTEAGRSAGAGFAPEKVSRALATGDIDNDGDLDLLVTNNGQTADVLRNDGGNANNALLVRMIGTRSNRSAVGARVRVTAGSTTQVREVKAGSSYLAQNDLRVHVGVGRAARIDRLEIRWPAGEVEVVEDVPINHIVTIVEGKGITGRTPF